MILYDQRVLNDDELINEYWLTEFKWFKVLIVANEEVFIEQEFFLIKKKC